MGLGQALYYFARIGELFSRPVDMRFRAAYDAAGEVWVPDPRRGLSHPGAELVREAEGVLRFSGLPQATAWALVGMHLAVPGGVQGVCVATFRIGSGLPATGDGPPESVIIDTRDSTQGQLADPADTSEIAVTLRGETGAY